MFPSTFKDLLGLTFSAFPGNETDIQFTKRIEDLEVYPEQGMRARIIGIKRSNHDDIVVMTVSYENYDTYNTQFESSNYYDKLGNAILNARQSGNYTLTEELFFDERSNPNDFFVQLESPSKALYDAYLARRLNDQESYVDFLTRMTKEHLDKQQMSAQTLADLIAIVSKEETVHELVGRLVNCKTNMPASRTLGDEEKCDTAIAVLRQAMKNCYGEEYE